MNLFFKVRRLPLQLAGVFLFAALLAGCAGRSALLPDYALPGSPDPSLFLQLEAREEQEDWGGLLDLSAYVLAHSELSDRERAWGFYYGGCAHLALGNGPRALACARQAALFLPREIKPQILHGLAEISCGHSLRGAEIMRSLAAAHPQSLPVLLGMGRANELGGRPDAACVWYEQAVQLEPDNPRAVLALALSRWAGGNAEGALRDFDRLLELHAGSPAELAAAHNDRGVILLSLGRFQDAGRAFELAVSIDPNNPDARLNRAEFSVFAGRHAEARTDFEVGLALHPDHAGLLIGLGRLEQAEANYFEAYSAFEAAYVYQRRNPRVLNELSWFLATCPDTSLRNGERAVGLAERAIILSRIPEPGLYDTLAAAYAAAGQFTEARDTQTTAVFLGEKAGLAAPVLAEWKKRLNLYEQGESFYAR